MLTVVVLHYRRLPQSFLVLYPAVCCLRVGVRASGAPRHRLAVILSHSPALCLPILFLQARIDLSSLEVVYTMGGELIAQIEQDPVTNKVWLCVCVCMRVGIFECAATYLDFDLLFSSV